MDRIETSQLYHKKGYNCCQSVLAAFGDRLPLPEESWLTIGVGFGSGAGTGELCGALTGAIMALDLMLPGDVMNDPVGSKKRAVTRSRTVQQRFAERFGALRCQELLQNKKEEASDAVKAYNITGHCAVMIATAVELVQEILDEEGV